MLLRLSLVLGLLAIGLSSLGHEPEAQPTVQILFTNPEGAKVYWDVSKPGAFDSSGLPFPGRHNFPANAIYRLRVNGLPGRTSLELYPTLEIGPWIPRSEKFLATNAISVQFTPEDISHVVKGTAVTKVIYLPDEEFAELAFGGVDTLVSFLLDPGVDPITEADRRGVILAIVRLHDKEFVTTPAEVVAESPKSEPATVATPVDSPVRGFRNRRGWFRRR